MVLLWAVIAGLLAASIRARVRGRPLMSPDLRRIWLVIVAVVPQLLLFYLPVPGDGWADNSVAGVLVTSQSLLMIFVWLNRRQPAFWLLGLGLTLNLAVISLNGGFMPISPEIVTKLLPNATPDTWELGSRLGRSKDIVLPLAETRLWFLSDRFLLMLPSRTAFSLGDLLIAVGAFRFLWAMGGPEPGSPLQNHLSPPAPRCPPSEELSRLVAAAVVDQKFCRLLLENPAVALESSYGSESFQLSAEEKALVLSVQYPASLVDFAAQLTDNYGKLSRDSDSTQD